MYTSSLKHYKLKFNDKIDKLENNYQIQSERCINASEINSIKYSINNSIDALISINGALTESVSKIAEINNKIDNTRLNILELSSQFDNLEEEINTVDNNLYQLSTYTSGVADLINSKCKIDCTIGDIKEELRFLSKNYYEIIRGIHNSDTLIKDKISKLEKDIENKENLINLFKDSDNEYLLSTYQLWEKLNAVTEIKYQQKLNEYYQINSENNISAEFNELILNLKNNNFTDITDIEIKSLLSGIEELSGILSQN